MKQPKVLPDPPTPKRPPAPSGPRYRFFSTPPSEIPMPLRDLSAHLPEDIRTPAFRPDRIVTVPCEKIFQGPSPKISLTLLVALAPECFRAEAISDAQISLPAANLARAYRMVVSSELIEEPVAEEPVAETPVTVEPVVEEPVVEEPKNSFPAPDAPQIPKVGLEESTEHKGTGVPNVQKKEFSLTTKEAVPESEQVLPAETTPEQSAPTPAPPETRPTPPSKAKSPFLFLPIFRRKEPEPETPPAAATPVVTTPSPRARVHIPKPRAPVVPFGPTTRTEPPPAEPASPPPESTATPTATPEPATKPVLIRPPVSKPPGVPADNAAPHPPPEAQDEGTETTETTETTEGTERIEATQATQATKPAAFFIETEHFSKAGKKFPPEIPEQDALQAIFMTEEILEMDRVIELCGDLPGVKSCVLSHGAAVLASHHVPDTIDLVSLSAHAMEMLEAMRSSAAKMGVGAVPAVTIHSDKGPITFFNERDLCLLVLHKDRGFVPGVREKLQHVVEALSRANLALPVSSGTRRLKP